MSSTFLCRVVRGRELPEQHRGERQSKEDVNCGKKWSRVYEGKPGLVEMRNKKVNGDRGKK
jgi:hypothetical protein